MLNAGILGTLIVVLHVALQIVFILRALLREHREPASRIAWVLVILSVPAGGMIAYMMFGETNIGWRRAERYRKSRKLVESLARVPSDISAEHLVDEEHRHLFRTGESIGGFPPVAGNVATLLPDSNSAIDAMVADIDKATGHVHLLFYIWLGDTNGLKMVEALKRAAARGVTVRAMADDLGSRHLIRSDHWAAMAKAGVRLAQALPLRNPLLHPFLGRIDLRNHRKIVVIDNSITYCGSQNCADPEFRIKAKYAPWVDIMVRFQGPIARQNQWLFVTDWMAHVDEDLRDQPSAAIPAISPADGVLAQTIGTGPTVRASAMPEVFEVLIHAARDRLLLTTPYYVPTEAMQSALCVAARRGVDVRIGVPARNDSFIVAAASRSYYPELLDAGVRIFEYPHGLLHSKSLTLDDNISLIGSANLDRRSFELNYENSILLQDAVLTADIRARQQSYFDASTEIEARDVAGWSRSRRLWYNSVAMMGPVL